jgi:glutathione peroxidase
MPHAIIALSLGLLSFALVAPVAPVQAAAGQEDEEDLRRFRFPSIDGGEIGFGDWAGRPVLVANTASFCAFAPQYAELQALYDEYRDQGLVVLAVPSDDFNQEYGTDAEVAEYCELNYGLDLPMAAISHVRGPDALPFYQWLRESAGIAPQWNFNKVLIGADGAVAGSWGSMSSPTGPEIRAAVEAALPR